MLPEAAEKLRKHGFNAPLALYMRELNACFDARDGFAIISVMASARRGAVGCLIDK
jgi:hypothetical protein